MVFRIVYIVENFVEFSGVKSWVGYAIDRSRRRKYKSSIRIRHEIYGYCIKITVQNTNVSHSYKNTFDSQRRTIAYVWRRECARVRERESEKVCECEKRVPCSHRFISDRSGFRTRIDDFERRRYFGGQILTGHPNGVNENLKCLSDCRNTRKNEEVGKKEKERDFVLLATRAFDTNKRL